MRVSIPVTVIAAAFLVASPVYAQVEQVGIAAGVRGDIRLAPRGAAADVAGVIVKSGQPVNVGERVRSGPDGAMQVILLDESVFTIGPNSEIEIEDFGFDARTGRGKIEASIGTGSFRFISGRIAQTRPEDMKVKVPNAIIGVRGTIVYGTSDTNQAVIALGGPGARRDRDINDKVGAITVATPQGAVDVRRSGYAAYVTRGGAPELRALDAASLQRIFGGLSAVQSAAAQGGSSGSSGGSGSGGRARRSSAGGGGDDGGGGGDSALASLMAAAGQATSSVSADAARAVQMQLQQQDPPINVPAFVPGAITSPQEIIGLAGTGTFTRSNNALAGIGGTGGAGTYDFTMTVDFGARTVGATFGNITIAAGGNAVAGATVTIVPTSYAGAPAAAPFIIQNNVANNCGAGVTCNAQAGMQNSATRAADVGIYQLTVTAGANVSQSAVITTPPRP